MEIINADKNSEIMFSNKKINKANYIIAFKTLDKVFGLVTKFIFIGNKKTLKQVVKQYSISEDLLIYGFENGRYSLFKLKWCI